MWLRSIYRLEIESRLILSIRDGCKGIWRITILIRKQWIVVSCLVIEEYIIHKIS